MFKGTFSAIIKAPVETVRTTMISPEGYRVRTAPFNPVGSWFEGDWNKGSMIRFLGPHPQHPEKIGGMLSEIVENRRFEYISIRHIGEISEGIVISKEPFKDAFENYSFSEQDGVTTVEVEITMNLADNFAAYMAETRPKALKVLKNLCEKTPE